MVLDKVSVNTEVPPVATEAGENDLVIEGGTKTVSVPLAALLEPAFPVVTGPVEFVYDPADALVTLTVTVQELLAAMVAPLSAKVLPLLAAATDPPVQLVTALALFVLTRPDG